MAEDSGQEKKTADNKNGPVWWQPAIIMFMKLSAWIAVPVIIGLFVGQWLDNKYHSSPWLFLLSIGVAFIVSIIGLVRNTMAELNRIDEQSKKKQKNKEIN